MPMGGTVAQTTTPSWRSLPRGRDSVLERFCIAGLGETSKGLTVHLCVLWIRDINLRLLMVGSQTGPLGDVAAIGASDRWILAARFLVYSSRRSS